MRTFALARIGGADEPALGVVVDGRVLMLAELWPHDDVPLTMTEMLADWDRHLDVVATALDGTLSSRWIHEQEVQFLAPVEPAATLYCAGANYYDHIEEMGAPNIDKATTPPFHFVVPTAALLGHGAKVIRPPDVELLDWEVELAVVMGRRVFKVPAERALEHVAGYTIANDVSGRDPGKLVHPVFGVDFLWCKGQTTFKPLGPVLVPARFLPDPGNLGLRLWVNDQIRQDSSTAKMIFTVEEQVAHLSASRPLLPGDVVLTGTPAGTAAAHGGYLQPGDLMAAEIDGLGRLENPVAAAARN
jgi:2-keto-4-pentenoate hydratase/2-oxohepta-3-ene-1,7-dioic acid hydratase in catechol pathway